MFDWFLKSSVLILLAPLQLLSHTKPRKITLARSVKNKQESPSRTPAAAVTLFFFVDSFEKWIRVSATVFLVQVGNAVVTDVLTFCFTHVAVGVRPYFCEVPLLSCIWSTI